jgi:uncharacterized Zn finger protein
MPSVADLVGPSAIEKLAIPSNIRLGRELAAQGAVEFLEFGPLVVKAKVRINQTRTVELRSVRGKLAWKCTCRSRADMFCKHCVAVALVTRGEAPKLRR